MAGVSFPRRGEIYWVRLDPTVGTEIAKTRPALVISNDVGNRHAEHLIVAPMTSRAIDRVYPFEVLIPLGEGGVDRASKVALDQIRAVSKKRLGARIGALAGDRLAQVDAAIRLSLDV
jgi:mRNA interferase MazF